MLRGVRKRESGEKRSGQQTECWRPWCYPRMVLNGASGLPEAWSLKLPPSEEIHTWIIQSVWKAATVWNMGNCPILCKLVNFCFLQLHVLVALVIENLNWNIVLYSTKSAIRCYSICWQSVVVVVGLSVKSGTGDILTLCDTFIIGL